MRILTPCLLIAFTCLALSVSVSSVAQAEEKAKKKPDPAKMFEKKDANGDGSLTLDEFKKGMKEKQLEFAEKRFKRLDADGDGKVTLDELKAGLAGMGQKKKKEYLFCKGGRFFRTFDARFCLETTFLSCLFSPVMEK